MQCQKCKKKAAAVDKVERPDGIIYRRYKCKECDQSFYTMDFRIIPDSIFKEDWNANHRLTKFKEKKRQQCGRKKKKQSIEID